MTRSSVASSWPSSPTRRPSRMTRMRSATASTSGRSEEMTAPRPLPRLASARPSAGWISALAPTSTPRVGVVGDAHLEEEAVFLAILGQIADPGGDRPGRGPASMRRPMTWTSPVTPGRPPKIPVASSVRPAPTSPASATISPRRTRSVTSRNRGRPPRRALCRSVRGPPARSASRPGAPPAAAGESRSAPDHPRDEIPGGHLADQECPFARAVPEDGHAVGDLEDLLEPVRDVDHARSAARGRRRITANSVPTSAPPRRRSARRR